MTQWYRRKATIGVVAIAVAVLLWTVPASAAITVTEKMTGGFGAAQGSSLNQSSWTTTDSFAIASGAISLCAVVTTDSDTAETYASLSQGAVTYTEIVTTNWAGSNIGRISWFWAPGSIASAALVLSITGSDNQTGVMIHCYEVAGADTSTPVLQFKAGTSTATTTHTLTLDSARTANAALFFAFGSESAVTWTPEYANTGTKGTYSTPTTEGQTEWVIGGSDTTPLWTSSNNQSAGFVAVEIKEAAAGGGTPGCKGGLLMMGMGCL